MKTKLEVGDRICIMCRGAISSVDVIARVTKTMAMTERDTRYKREIGPLGIKLVTRDVWSQCSYQLETPELSALRQLQTKRKKTRITLNELTASVDQLNAIELEILDDVLTKYKKEIE